MMQKRSCCHGNMVGPACSSCCAPSSFSMLFSNNNHKTTSFGGGEDVMTMNMYSSLSSSSSSSHASVDCTLSLATPSSSARCFNHKQQQTKDRRHRLPNFCWDILPPPPPPPSANKSGGGDGTVPRRCANCDTTSTPLWRNGPRGPKSLCNACGIRFKKEERRASAAAANGGGVEYETRHWTHHHHTTHQKMGYFSSSAYGNEFRFIADDNDRHSNNSAATIPFISWRFNNVVHDFTTS